MTKLLKNKLTPLIAIILLAVMVAGCTKPTSTSVPPTPAPTETTAPATTEIPASLLLVDPNGTATAETKAAVQNFATTNGLAYQEAADLGGDLTAVKVAVVFGDAANFKDQAVAQPATQFIFVGATNETAAGNISLVRNRPQDLAFMAGYLSSIVAEDWRAGGLLSSNTLPVDNIIDAFYNGGKLICNNCAPVYPPYPSYSPLYQDISGKTGGDMLADVDALAQFKIDTLFVSMQADLPEVLDAAEAAQMFLIGENAASANAARYAAILGYDVNTALETMLPVALAGRGGQTAVTKVMLVVANNTQKITPGKQAQFAVIAELLANDEIIPLSVN